MKRTHSNQNKEKKAEIRKLVLEQLRKTRKKMKREHPGLLEKMRDVLEKSKKKQAAQNKNPARRIVQNELNIDQTKNIEAVEKMLDLKGRNPQFEKAVKAMLSKKK